MNKTFNFYEKVGDHYIVYEFSYDKILKLSESIEIDKIHEIFSEITKKIHEKNENPTLSDLISQINNFVTTNNIQISQEKNENFVFDYESFSINLKNNNFKDSHFIFDHIQNQINKNTNQESEKTSSEENLKNLISLNLIQALNKTEKSEIVDLEVIFPHSRDSKIGEKYKIKDFPKNQYNSFITAIDNASSYPSFPFTSWQHFLLNVIQNMNLYVQIETVDNNATLRKFYFLDNKPKNTKEKIRRKYEIYLNMSLAEFNEKSFKYMIDDFQNSNQENFNLNRFLQDSNIALYKDLIKEIKDSKGESIDVVLQEAIYIDNNMKKTGDVKSDIYTIYSDAQDLQKSYIDFHSESMSINPYPSIGFLVGNFDNSIITLENKKLNLDEISAKLDQNNKAMIFKNNGSKAVKIEYYYDFDSKNNKLRKFLFASPEINSNNFRSNFFKYNLDALKSFCHNNYYLGEIKDCEIIELEFITSDQRSFKLQIDKAEGKYISDFIKKNLGRMTIDQLISSIQSNFLEFIFKKEETTSNFDKKFCFHYFDEKMQKIIRHEFDFSKNSNYQDIFKKLSDKFSNEYPKTVSEAENFIKTLTTNYILQKQQYLETEFYETWEPSSEDDLVMIKRKYAYSSDSSIVSKEFQNSNHAFKEIDFNSIKDGAKLIFTTYKDFSFGPSSDCFLKINEEERYAFFFLDVNSNSNAQMYVIDPCLDFNNLKVDEVNSSIYQLSLNTKENILEVWMYHYRCYKKMSGWKFSTFWDWFSNDKLFEENLGQNYAKNPEKTKADNYIAQIYMKNPQYYIYGKTRDSKHYRIGISDNARSTADIDVFDPIRNNIHSNWVWANPDYSCLYNPSNANRGSGCYELRYARELQKKDQGFMDT